MPTYPLTMPASPAPNRSSLRIIRVSALSQSPFSGRQQVVQWPSALWQAEISLPPMRRDKAGPWQAFILSLAGRTGTFLMGDPDAKTPRGTARSGVAVNGAGQTGNVLNVRGMVNTTLLKGDYIQVGSGSTARLHMVVNDHGGGPGGVTPLEIEPPLKFSPADGAAVVVVNAVGLWRMSASDPGWDSDAASIYGFTFACHEAY
jgi:hypothetical protein